MSAYDLDETGACWFGPTATSDGAAARGRRDPCAALRGAMTDIMGLHG